MLILLRLLQSKYTKLQLKNIPPVDRNVKMLCVDELCNIYTLFLIGNMPL